MDVCNHHPCQSEHILVTSKRNLTLFSSYSLHTHPILFVSPKQPLICFLSLCFGLFWTFHVNGVIQYLVFCDWLRSHSLMFSSFIGAVACIRMSFLFFFF